MIGSQHARAALMHKLMENRSLNPSEMGVQTKEAQPDQTIRVSNCILVTNMFDPFEVNLDEDPTFFVEIKEQVQDVCSQWGDIDTIFVEQNSPGHVWVRFRG